VPAKKPHRVHVQHSDGKVALIPWDKADDLVSKERAIFISNTLFKAAKAGINIQNIKGKDRQNDRVLKERILERLSKQATKKAAKEKASKEGK
jgi:hypothetical protein